MVNILQVAKSNLITKVSVSKEVLQNYIDTNELDNLDTSKYLTSTATPFVDALKVAHDLIASDDATVKQLEDALMMNDLEDLKRVHNLANYLMVKRIKDNVKVAEA